MIYFGKSKRKVINLNERVGSYLKAISLVGFGLGVVFLCIFWLSNISLKGFNYFVWGSIGFFVLFLPMYGFGEIIERTQETAKTTKEILQLLQFHTDENKENGK